MHRLRTEFRDGCKLTVVQGETFDAIHDANQVLTRPSANVPSVRLIRSPLGAVWQVMDLTEFCEWVRRVGLLPEFVSVAEAKRVFCEVSCLFCGA